jgi:hypothetical protein
VQCVWLIYSRFFKSVHFSGHFYDVIEPMKYGRIISWSSCSTM